MFRLTFTIAFVCALLLSGCGSKRALSINAAKKSSNDGGTDPIEQVASCAGNLQAGLSIVSPSGPLFAGHPIVFQVAAHGCSGSYVVESDLTHPFSSQKTLPAETFPSPGRVSKSVRVYALDAEGNIQASVMAGPLSFDVGSAAAPSVSLPAAPQCTLQQITNFGAATPNVTFLMHLQGIASAAVVNQAPVIPGTNFVRSPAQGRFDLFGSVTGPGGTGLCELHIVTPACTLAASAIDSLATRFTLTYSGPVVRGEIDGTGVAFSPAPATVAYRNATFATAGSKQSVANVWTASGDQNTCFVDHSVYERITRTVSSNTAVAIPDSPTWGRANPHGSGATASTSLYFPDNLDIERVNVRLSLSNSYLDDNEVAMVSPAGTSVIVQSSGVYLNLPRVYSVGTIDQVYSALAGEASNANSLIPALANYAHQMSQGNWTLNMKDWGAVDAGRLNNWSLTVIGLKR